jgi:hypothetical protein
MPARPQTWTQPMPPTLDLAEADLAVVVDKVGRATLYSLVSPATTAIALRELADGVTPPMDNLTVRAGLIQSLVGMTELCQDVGPYGSVPAGVLLGHLVQLRNVIELVA